MNLREEKQAQGSIELLLLVGAAITIAAIIGAMLKQAASSLQEEAGKRAEGAASG